MCVEVFSAVSSRAKGPKGAAGGSLQTLHPACPPGAPVPARSCGWNAFPKRAQSTSACLQGQGSGCDCWSWRQEQKFPSTLSRVERLQTLPVGSAGARLCCCCGTGCGTLQNPCLCRTTSRPGSPGNPGGHGRLVGEFKPPDSPWLAATVSQLGKRLAVPLCPQLEQGELMAPSCWRAALTARVLIP